MVLQLILSHPLLCFTEDILPGFVQDAITLDTVVLQTLTRLAVLDMDTPTRGVSKNYHASFPTCKVGYNHALLGTEYPHATQTARCVTSFSPPLGGTLLRSVMVVYRTVEKRPIFKWVFLIKHLRFDIFELQETNLLMRLINTTNEWRLFQEHETPLRVKGDIEDVSIELDNGVKGALLG
ncbi:hypothetical protein TNCV_4895481 [Trichonephila clavipes]|nr:hypothetical protein TNCV_4895481 [Trichonephila clavipes]